MLGRIQTSSSHDALLFRDMNEEVPAGPHRASPDTKDMPRTQLEINKKPEHQFQSQMPWENQHQHDLGSLEVVWTSTSPTIHGKGAVLALGPVPNLSRMGIFTDHINTVY
jgi:hypothetical protein